MKTDFKNMNRDFLSSFSPLVFLVPIAPIAALYIWNAQRLTPEHFFSSLGAVFIPFFLFVLILRQVFISKPMADVFAASIFIGFLYPMDLQDYWSILWILIFLILPVMASFQSKLLKPLKLGMYFLALNLVVQSLLLSGNKSVLWKRGKLVQNFNAGFNVQTPIKAENIKRDVYYIVLDRYARADQLKSIYGFDNTEFTNALKGHGLQVADASFSNYQRTAHSLTSSLNISYLPSVESGRNLDWIPLYERLRDSQVVRYFKRLDYEFHNMGSWWEVTRKNDRADREFNYRAWPELLRVFLQHSASGKLAFVTGIPNVDQRKLQCVRAKQKFTELQQQVQRSNLDKPKFVFAHFLIPHPPYVVDRDGNCISVELAKSRSREQNYVEQVMFANTQILKFLERVKSSEGPKPIIILQADEGPWPKKFVYDEILHLGRDVTSVNWAEVDRDDLIEKMAILNAIYFPDRPNVEFPSDASPVNNFRRVLNEYYSGDFPILKSRSLIYPNNGDLYRYEDVTEKLK